jgi:beta-ureidopropionase
MSNVVKGCLIQASVPVQYDPDERNHMEVKEAMIDKHEGLIEEAADKGAEITCLQEIFHGPYFMADKPNIETNTDWYHTAEPIPDGPTTKLVQDYAEKHNMVIVAPIFEEAMTGVYYNSAAVIDADGSYLGKFRKIQIPDCNPGFFEKFYFKPGNLGYPVFETEYGNVGVYICYDRHFPEGARILGLRGAEIVFNPSATVDGLSRYLWELEQPAHAANNQYFIGAINRVGREYPWDIGKWYGSSYFANPRGQIVDQASEDEDEVLVVDLDLDEIDETREKYPFYQDRRPDAYDDLTELLP